MRVPVSPKFAASFARASGASMSASFARVSRGTPMPHTAKRPAVFPKYSRRVIAAIGSSLDLSQRVAVPDY
jgi:hypothetical protein